MQLYGDTDSKTVIASNFKLNHKRILLSCVVQVYVRTKRELLAAAILEYIGHMYMMTSKKEIENLKYMWNRHSAPFLATYLSKNLGMARSFYTRKILLDYLVQKNPNTDLGREERFVQPMVRLFLQNLLYAQTHAQALAPFLTRCFHDLFLLVSKVRTFRLNGKTLNKASVLDVGCGAGNYYRVFVVSGLAQMLRYHGVDIAEKNIEICKRAFSHKEYSLAEFSVGNICDMKFADQSFDVVMVNSVFEHLSPEMLPVALGETVRVAKDLIIINFFNEQDIPNHIITPHLKYHWNRLSRKKIIETLCAYGVLRGNIAIIDRYPPFSGGKRIQFKKSGARAHQSFSYSTMIIKKPTT